MKEGKVLALDYGEKRVGLATGDFENMIAFPRGVIENKGIEALLDEILAFCSDWEVKTIVIGLPLDMREEKKTNEMTGKVKFLMEKMRQNKNFDKIKIDFFDERLSTFEADELLNKVDDKKLLRDEIAAQIILQRYFDVH